MMGSSAIDRSGGAPMLAGSDRRMPPSSLLPPQYSNDPDDQAADSLERGRPERVLSPWRLAAEHADQAADERVRHKRRGTPADAELERRKAERPPDHGTLEKTEHEAKHG